MLPLSSLPSVYREAEIAYTLWELRMEQLISLMKKIVVEVELISCICNLKLCQNDAYKGEKLEWQVKAQQESQADLDKYCEILEGSLLGFSEIWENVEKQFDELVAYFPRMLSAGDLRLLMLIERWADAKGESTEETKERLTIMAKNVTSVSRYSMEGVKRRFVFDCAGELRTLADHFEMELGATCRKLYNKETYTVPAVMKAFSEMVNGVPVAREIKSHRDFHRN